MVEYDSIKVKDQLGRPEDKTITPKRFTDEVVVEPNTVTVKYNTVGTSFILSSVDLGILDTSTLGEAGRVETLLRVVNPNKVYREHFTNANFEDTTITTADWSDTEGLLKMTTGEIAQSLQIALNDGEITGATMTVTIDSGDVADLTLQISNDGGGSFNTVSNGVTYSFTEFTPTDLSGLALWLDASKSVYLDTSTAPPDVDGWTDRVASLKLSQSTAARKPHTGGTIGTNSAIIFDGNDDYLVVNDTTTLTGNVGTCFVLVQFDTLPSANGNIIATGDNSSSAANQFTAARIEYTTDSEPRFSVSSRLSGTTNNMRGTTVPEAGKTYIITTQSDGATWTMRINGVSESLSAASGSNVGHWFNDVTGVDNIAVGAIVRSVASGYSNATLGEILVYDGVSLSAAQVKQVEHYLAMKWGIQTGHDLRFKITSAGTVDLSLVRISYS